jgi:hypothetical protein
MDGPHLLFSPLIGSPLRTLLVHDLDPRVKNLLSTSLRERRHRRLTRRLIAVRSGNGLELSPQEFFFEPIAVGRHGRSADIRVS